jgi:hypothetical protein
MPVHAWSHALLCLSVILVASTQVPSPYLLVQIEQLANESAESAQSIAEHVLRNLQDRRPVVKWKVPLPWYPCAWPSPAKAIQHQ